MLSTATDVEILGRLGKALVDPVRCRLLLALLDGPGYPADLAEALSVSRSRLSNHLACLRGCGLVVATPDGRRLRYELADHRLAHALDDLRRVVLAVEADRGACAQAPSEGCC
ncbi:ArsR/SmtB family transcription factor [Kineococcus gynurae]|uniref:ArsR/SmtB family transcription factor n=1 Tax=Kineococcus gynurae TaxID=452979 RepID=A0ABV5LNG0_9ACTN